jgi:hypothetical protein
MQCCRSGAYLRVGRDVAVGDVPSEPMCLPLQLSTVLHDGHHADPVEIPVTVPNMAAVQDGVVVESFGKAPPLRAAEGSPYFCHRL